MNRFGKKSSKLSFLSKAKIPILAFFALFLAFLYGISSVSSTTKEKQAESLKSTIHKNIVHCYAVEGTYPPSLDYLESHYGLIYDKDAFFVDYQSIGSNLMPDVTIIIKNSQ